MADINKPDLTNLWASDGAVIPPSPSKIQTGWVAEIPPHQWENYVQNRQDVALAYLLQKGVPEWDNTTEYIANKSVVTYNGNIYFAIQTSTNNNPSSSPSHWIPLEEKFADSLGLGTAATRDVGTGANEVPANSDLGSAATRDVGIDDGEVLVVGNAFGLGQAAGLPAPSDLNNATKNGFYCINEDALNAPRPFDGAMIVVGEVPVTPDGLEGDIMQFATTRGGDDLWIRGADSADSNGNPIWSEWKNIMPLGVGQTWQDMTGQRAKDVTYTNTTGRTIIVTVVGRSVTTSAVGSIRLFVDELIVDISQVTADTGSANSYPNVSAAIPPGSSYLLSEGAFPTNIFYWRELR